MPNYCDNKMIISGPDDQLDEFVKLAESPSDGQGQKDEKAEEDLLAFDKIVPLSKAALKGPKKSLGWAAEREAWGVKWGAIGTERAYEPDDGLVEYRFATAWAPPLEFLRRASKRFPELEFDLRYEEEGVGLFGRALFQNGVTIREIQWDFESSELLRQALAQQALGTFRFDLLPKSSLLLFPELTGAQLRELGQRIQKRFEKAAGIADKLKANGWTCRLREMDEVSCSHEKVKTHKEMKEKLAEAGIDWTLCI